MREIAATREVSGNTNGVKPAAEDNGRSAASALNVAQELSNHAVTLQGRVDDFRRNVRVMQ